MQNKVNDILTNWGITNTEFIQQFNVGGYRLVYQVKTEIGIIILKGQPISLDENAIMNNISAQEYLGNKHNLAPHIYYRPDGSAIWKNDEYYYYVMDFIDGRNVQETIEDEWLLGEAAAKMHTLTGYDIPCSFDINEDIQQMKSRYGDRKWKDDYDVLISSLPDFYKHRQCFIHSDIGSNNAKIHDGSVIFIDLDDAGIGSQYVDLGWLFITHFVKYDEDRKQFFYAFDLAKSFLNGYCSKYKLDKQEYDLIWKGAVYSHIYNMQWFGDNAADHLWEKLCFGIKQKDSLLQLIDL